MATELSRSVGAARRAEGRVLDQDRWPVGPALCHRAPGIGVGVLGGPAGGLGP